MGIRLVRESSEAPNITNRDDVRMIRYAYGGANGVVSGYGDMLTAKGEGTGTLTIGSGRFVLYGWEVDFDGSGWSIDVSSMNSAVYYYSVYLEINAEVETATVKTLYGVKDYPEISSGDDLTKIPNGTACFLLYKVFVQNGTVKEAVSQFGEIPYMDSVTRLHTEQISEIKSRLDSLGFREGVVSYAGASSVTINSLKKQGKYVRFNFESKRANGNFGFIVPEGFRPKETVKIIGILDPSYYTVDDPVYPSSFPACVITVYTNGSTSVDDYSGLFGGMYIYNAGWEIA